MAPKRSSEAQNVTGSDDILANPSKRQKGNKPKPSHAAPKATAKKVKTEAPGDRVRKGLTARKEAVKSNPRGVRLVRGDIINDLRQMAGYVNISSTKALRDFLEDDTINAILTKWGNARSNGFGVVNKSVTSPWLAKNLFEFITDPQSMSTEELENLTVPLPVDEYPGSEDRRGYVSWLVTIFQLFSASPERFPDRDNPAVEKVLGGVSAEDWNRGYEVLRVYWRLRSVSRTTEHKKEQDNVAQLPDFLGDDDYTMLASNSLDDPDMLTAVNMSAYLDGVDALDEMTDVSEDEQGASNSAELEEGHYIDFAAAMGNMPADLGGTLQTNVRPPLDEARRNALLSRLYSKSRVLYPEGGIFEVNSSAAPARNDFIADSISAEALGSAEEVDEGAVSRFIQLQKQLNSASATPPPYETACRFLGLDEKAPRVGDVQLFAHQVQGVAWLLLMEQSDLAAGLLADDVGLGKTIQALSLIELSIQRRLLDASLAMMDQPDENEPQSDTSKLTAVDFKPTLIVFPSAAHGVWKSEIAEYFPKFTTKYFIGSMSKGPIKDRSKTLGSQPDDIIKFVRGLDPNDPQTGRTVILTTYTTFHYRTLDTTAAIAIADSEKRTKKGRTTAAPVIDANEEIEDDDFAEVDEEILNLMVTKFQDTSIFDRLICDEAHKVKSPRTKSFKALADLNFRWRIMITASAMLNKPVDLVGPLSLIFQPAWSRGQVSADDYASELPAIEQVNSLVADASDELTAVDLSRFLYLLEPDSFRKQALTTGIDGQMNVEIARKVIPSLWKLFQLRRTMSDNVVVNGKAEPIGKVIPTYRCYTVELQPTQTQLNAYLAEYSKLIIHRSAGGDSETKEGHVNMAVHRSLCQITVNPELAKLKPKAMAKNVNKYHERFQDCGATFYYKSTIGNKHAPPYSDRFDMAIYMAALAPKLQWLAGPLSFYCVQLKEKILIFMGRPGTLHHMEAYLTNLGFHVGVLRAANTMEERRNIVAAFNDPSHPMNILLTTPPVGGTSYNIQHCCRIVIWIEPFSSADTGYQGIGRVWRIRKNMEKNKEVIVFILTTNYSYDQLVQALAAQKMLGQLAGRANIEVTDEEIQAYRAAHPEDYQQEDESYDDDSAQSRIFQAKLEGLYMESWGQRSSRVNWSSKDLWAKDGLPQEREFLARKVAENPKLSLRMPSTAKSIAERFGSVEKPKAPKPTATIDDNSKPEAAGQKPKAPKNTTTTGDNAKPKAADNPNPTADPACIPSVPVVKAVTPTENLSPHLEPHHPGIANKTIGGLAPESTDAEALIGGADDSPRSLNKSDKVSSHGNPSPSPPMDITAASPVIRSSRVLRKPANEPVNKPAKKLAYRQVKPSRGKTSKAKPPVAKRGTKGRKGSKTDEDDDYKG